MRAFSTLMILPRSGSTAWVLRSRPCLAEPPAESPSTMKSSASAGSRDRAVGELAGQGRVLQRRLAAGQVAGFAGRLAGAGGVDRLADDPPRLARVLLEELAQLAVDGLFDQALDRRVAEFGLRLALELRVLELDRDHRGEALADVVAGQVLVFLLEQPLAAGVGVQRPGQRRAEAGEVGAALVGVDVVGEAEDRFLVGGVPLHRDLDLAVVGLALEEDGLAVQRVLVLVQVGDEVDDPALVVEAVALAGAALVDQLDLQAAGEEGGLAQALGQGRVVELELVEDLVVGEEGDRGPGRLGRRALLQVGERLAALVVLGPDVAVAADLEVQALGERVDDRDADAVQAAGDFVAAAVAELAAGVQGGQHHLGRRPLLLLQFVDRDAAAVVDDRAAVVRGAGRPGRCRSGRRSPRRPSCRRPRRRGGGGRGGRSSRCTCRGACGPPRGPSRTVMSLAS